MKGYLENRNEGNIAQNALLPVPTISWVLFFSDQIEPCLFGSHPPPPPPPLFNEHRLLNEQLCFAFSCQLLSYSRHKLSYITYLTHSRDHLISICHSPNALWYVTCSLRGGLSSFLVMTCGFSSKQAAAVKTERLFTYNTSLVRGFSPIVSFGQKLDCQPG